MVPTNSPGRPDASSRYDIRAARLPDDLPGVLELYAETTRFHAESWPENFRPVGDSGSATDPAGGAGGGAEGMAGGGGLADELLSGYADPSRAMFVADRAGAVIGLISGGVAEPPAYGMERWDGRILWVHDVVVTATARRQGVGDRLLDRIEAWGRERGAVTAALHVFDANRAARALYDRRGFRPAHVTMRKPLDPPDSG